MNMQVIPMTVDEALKAADSYSHLAINGGMVQVLAAELRRTRDSHNIVTLIDERMGKGWTRELAHNLFPSAGLRSVPDAATDL